MLIDFTYSATVCGSTDIGQAIQAITEQVVDDSIICAGSSVDCVSFDAQVVISSLIIG